MKNFALFLIVTLSLSNLSAQDMTIEQTMQYINDKIAAMKPEYEFFGGFNHIRTQLGIELSPDGKITIKSKDRFYKSNDGYNSEDKTDYGSHAFYAADVSLDFNSHNPYEPHMPYLNIQCNANASLSKCVEMKSTIPGNDYNIDGYHINFDDEKAGKSIYNALAYLIKKITNDRKYAKTGSDDPFAPKVNANVAQLDAPSSANTTTSSVKNVVYMVKGESGVYEVPVMLNGVLKINFIFDSGASDVSISPDVALTLMRTGTIKQSDFVGSQKYQFADGSTATSRVFILHEIKLGKKTLRNVRASISGSIDAPMLLGQSVLQQFGKFTIDNANHSLTIE